MAEQVSNAIARFASLGYGQCLSFAMQLNNTLMRHPGVTPVEIATVLGSISDPALQEQVLHKLGPQGAPATLAPVAPTTPRKEQPNKRGRREDGARDRKEYRKKAKLESTVTFEGYEVLGDSIMGRFAEFALNKKPHYDAMRKRNSLGLCESGSTIKDLDHRIQGARLSGKCMIGIGTNDIMRQKPADAMVHDMTALLRTLQQKEVKEILVLAVPPIPRVQDDAARMEAWKKFNTFLKEDLFTTLDANLALPVIKFEDVTKVFLNLDGTVKEELFERVTRKGKPDSIHPNAGGNRMMAEHIRKAIKKVETQMETNNG